jgi:hypothetical protein
MASQNQDPEDGTSAEATRSDNTHESEDYSIFINIDGVKASAPWRIASYGQDGALSEEDIAELACRFDLPPDVLRTLSRQIGYCLDRDSTVNLVEINRRKAIERAGKVLEDVASRAKRVDADVRAIKDALNSLDTSFAESASDASLLTSAQAHVAHVRHAAAGLQDAIERVIETPGAAADMAPRDKRRVWDKRRQYTVESCCHAWLDARRPLTYTTVSDGSRRGRRHGCLVEFIQAVVGKVTEPPRELSPETLRKDIDRLRTNLAKPDPLSMPPDKSN